MNVVVAVRYPLRKNQLDTIRKAVELLGKRNRYFIVHVDEADTEKSEKLIKKELGMRISVLSRKGDIIAQLKKVCKELDADVLVLASHIKTGLDIMLEGLVETDPTVELIKSMKVPILIVK